MMRLRRSGNACQLPKICAWKSSAAWRRFRRRNSNECASRKRTTTVLNMQSARRSRALEGIDKDEQPNDEADRGNTTSRKQAAGCELNRLPRGGDHQADR